MANMKLEANYRSDVSKGYTKRIRRDGFVTGNIFGHDTESVAIEVKLRDVVDLIKSSEAGLMSLMDIKINNAPKKSDGAVILKSFIKDPLTRKVLDIQFQRVSMKEKLHVNVPVVTVGEAAGSNEGGIIEHITDQLSISCLPGDIPSRIEVDITNLEIGHNIRVSDLPLIEGVEILTGSDTLICTCVVPHISHEAETAAAEAGAETSEPSAESSEG